MTAAHNGSTDRDSADREFTDRESTGRMVRPYAMTRGRTSADVAEISLEAQIRCILDRTDPLADSADLVANHRWEAGRILQILEQPTALIEIAARADLPIGVVRVIIGDLVDEGVVAVQRERPVPSYASLLEKVLDGVRAL